ncbi:hypothetical protein H4582DRAFT_2057482 [Lactarius indigo]|nr:hypothetical protein H4582DRAFT_2057482 [Lactarius indigo]
MASDNLDVHEVALAGEQDRGPPQGASSATSPANSFPPLPIGPTTSQLAFVLSYPTPTLGNPRIFLDTPASPVPHTSDQSFSHPPPSLTPSALSVGTIHWDTSTVLRDNNIERNVGLASLNLLTPLSQGHYRKASAGTVSSIGSRSVNPDNVSLSLGGFSDSDLRNTHPPPTNIHVDARSDTSCPSLAAGFFKKTIQHGRHPSPSPSGETDMRSGATEEADLNVEPFAFKPCQLAHLVDHKSLENLESLGGMDGLLRGLGTDPVRGLNTTGKLTQPVSRVPEWGHPASLKFSARAYEATIEDRRRIYGQNILPQRLNKSLPPLDVAGAPGQSLVSLALGLFRDFGTHRPQGNLPWIGLKGLLSSWPVVSGDVVLLEPGEVAPCDGVFLSGHNVWCDESSATGESDPIKKLSYEECITLRRTAAHAALTSIGPSSEGESVSVSQRKPSPSGLDLLGDADCFVVGGSKVLEGVGSYVVTSVGTKSFNSRITMALRRDCENTPLRLKLNDLSEITAKIGSIAGGLLFAALLVRYFVQLGTNNSQRTSSEKGMAFMNILIIVLTLVVVAVPEGLPLTVAHALAFATKRMSKENLSVRVPRSCETMANASVICTDKTGTLTQNEMTTVAVSVGAHAELLCGDAASTIQCANFFNFIISAHFATVVIMIVWALASSSDKPILGAVQLLWIDIIMGTFATLALATDPGSPVLLGRNPDKETDPLFTVNMTKQILGQAAYQIIITLFLHFLGSRILGLHRTDDPILQKHHDEIVQTLVFNAFVFAQIFNSFNCRRLDIKLNVFEGVSKNRYFMAITTIEVAVQVLICFVGGAAFGVTRIGAREWFISVGLGCVSLPLGALIRLAPNEPCERAFKKLRLLPEPELLPMTRPDAESGSSFVVDQVRDNLGTFAQLRGGRMRGSSFVCESHSAFHDPSGPRPVPGRLAIVPSPEVSHFATPGWQPCTSGSHSHPVGFGQSGSSAAL